MGKAEIDSSQVTPDEQTSGREKEKSTRKTIAHPHV